VSHGSSSGFVNICTATSVSSTGGPLGILQDAVTSGHSAAVRLLGISKVYSSAAIAVGAQITSSTAGTAVTATSGGYILGTALTASTAAGELIDVLLTGIRQFSVLSTA